MKKLEMSLHDGKLQMRYEAEERLKAEQKYHIAALAIGCASFISFIYILFG